MSRFLKLFKSKSPFLSLPRILTMIRVKRVSYIKRVIDPRKQKRKKEKRKQAILDAKEASSNEHSTQTEIEPTMSAKENKSRDDVLAAREAKKLAKQKAKSKDILPDAQAEQTTSKDIPTDKKDITIGAKDTATKQNPIKSKDEVDKAILIEPDKERDSIKAERAAKKAAKQAKKKGTADGDTAKLPSSKETADSNVPKLLLKDTTIQLPSKEMTVKDVVETLKDIKNIAREVKEVTDKVKALDLKGKKDARDDKQADESTKSKAELRAERRAKQEAQRAAKQAAQQEKVVKPKESEEVKPEPDKIKKEKTPKPKVEKQKAKQTNQHTLNWFGHLYKEFDKDVLNKIPINSNLHPAIIKLGVQLATRVVSGSNARCIALLDALKKMVKDYSLPAKTEFGRGLESHLASSLQFLWSMRQPTASQTNAVKFFRHHLNQLPNNVDEFDAKKTLQEEIDRYIKEQIDMAGEAISLAVRKKISNGDNILTYGCSSLIERILVEAHEAGVEFRVVVCGAGSGASGRGAREMTRRLVASGLKCITVDITALNYVMRSVSKVVMGASALLGNGSVVGSAGTATTALAARALNVPVLIACETHKFSEQVQTDAFVYNELGDPEDLVDTSDDTCPLKDWRSNPNLTPLNLVYDVTPPSLITAVVTELAILPCTSAPVVLRFKLSEYGI